MSQLRTSMIIDLAGNLQSRAQQMLGSMQRLGTGGSRAMQIMGRGVDAASRGLDKLGNRYTAMLTGGGLALQVKQVGDLSERLTYLGIQAQLPKEKIDALYGSILRIAQDKNIRVSPSEILAGVETIVEKLGDMKLAEDNLRNIGYVIRATGAAGKDAGDMIANFKEKFNLKPEEMLPALDTLVLQGKAGAFTLKDMVTQGNRVTAAYGAMGRKGPQAVAELGAALQVFRKSSGSAEETSTAFKNFFNDLMEPAHQKILKANGIKIWDEEALKRGKKEIRSVVDITDQLLAKSKGDPEKLGRVLGMQTMDGFKAVINGYQLTGKNPMYEFLDITGQGKELMSDSARAAQEFNAALTNLTTAGQQFARLNLSKPIQQVADYLNSLSPEKTQQVLKNIKYIGLGLGGLVLTSKGLRLFNDARTALGRGGGAGIGGPVPVYVTNPGGSALDPITRKPVPVFNPAGIGPMASIGLALIPAATAAAVGALSINFAKNKSEREVSQYSTKTLQQKLAEQQVMGGGSTSYQARLIANELNKRGSGFGPVQGSIDITVNSEGQARVTRLQSSGVNLNIDTGLLMRSH